MPTIALFFNSFRLVPIRYLYDAGVSFTSASTLKTVGLLWMSHVTPLLAAIGHLCSWHRGHGAREQEHS